MNQDFNSPLRATFIVMLLLSAGGATHAAPGTATDKPPQPEPSSSAPATNEATDSRTAPAAATRMEDIILRDEKRGRDIECRVQYPAEGARLPLIVFSHGFGADRTAFTPIAGHWAAHGYVVVHPSHLDGSGTSAGKGGSLPAGGAAALQKNAVVKIENRVGDVTFILDALEQLATKVPALRGRIDHTRIGVGGHSLGAYTAMVVGGVTADIGDQKGRSFKDGRVRCILPISGQGIGQQGLTESSWTKLSLPMMTMTGSLDKGAGGQASSNAD